MVLITVKSLLLFGDQLIFTVSVLLLSASVVGNRSEELLCCMFSVSQQTDFSYFFLWCSELFWTNEDQHQCPGWGMPWPTHEILVVKCCPSLANIVANLCKVFDLMSTAYPYECYHETVFLHVVETDHFGYVIICFMLFHVSRACSIFSSVQGYRFYMSMLLVAKLVRGTM